MTLNDDGFHGIAEQVREWLYIGFVKNGGIREVSPNNIARELDDIWEYHIDEEEQTVQVLLFYHCLLEVIGFLPDYCFGTVNKYIGRYKQGDMSGILSESEQEEFHKFVSELLSQMQ